MRNQLKDKAKQIEENHYSTQAPTKKNSNDHLKAVFSELQKTQSNASVGAAVVTQFIKEEDLEIDETEDEANNIIKNKMRRMNGNKKLKRKQKSIDNDNPQGTNDELQFFQNTQDADADFMSGIGAVLKTKKRRERAGTLSNNNEAFQQLRKASSEVSDMVLYQQSMIAKEQSQQLSNSGESEIEKPEKIF